MKALKILAEMSLKDYFSFLAVVIIVVLGIEKTIDKVLMPGFIAVDSFAMRVWLYGLALQVVALAYVSVWKTRKFDKNCGLRISVTGFFYLCLVVGMSLLSGLDLSIDPTGPLEKVQRGLISFFSTSAPWFFLLAGFGASAAEIYDAFKESK